MARPFSLLIKPAGADCNLHCRYCFYLEKADMFAAPGGLLRMSSAVLERMVANYMATDQPNYTFGWQGGEPTLMGAGFFRNAVRLQEQYARPGAQISNGLQTNGTRISDELAELFAEYNFLIGISIDGPSELHDEFRPYESGRGSHAKVLDGLETLRRHSVDFNVLTVVNAANVHHPKALYRYLKNELGIVWHQYIPCVEFAPDGSLLPWSVDADSWGRFLCELYDEWAGDPQPASIRRFDAFMQKAAGGPPAMCSLATNCRQYFVVEHNGDVYPCDFFVEPELKLGNVTTHRFGEMWIDPTFRRFGRRKGEIPEQCRQCEFKAYCYGDCPKHRPAGGTVERPTAAGSAGTADHPTAAGATVETAGEPPVSVLCGAWKRFFAHALPDLERRAAGLASRPAAPTQHAE